MCLIFYELGTLSYKGLPSSQLILNSQFLTGKDYICERFKIMSILVHKILDFVGHQQAVYSIALLSNQNSFVSSGGDGFLVKWPLNSPEGVLIAKHNEPIYCVSANQSFVFTGSSNGNLSVFDIESNHLVKKIKLDANALFDIVFFEDKVLVATFSGKIMVLNSGFEIEQTVALSGKSIRKIKVIESGFIAVGSEPAVWRLSKNFELVKKYTHFNQSVFAIDYLEKQRTIICGGRDAVLEIINKEHETESIKAHLLHINDICLNDEKTMFLTASMDKTIKLWNSENFELLKVINSEKNGGHRSSVNKILWFDKNKFISCSDDKAIKSFEIL